MLYRASKPNCDARELEPRCSPKMLTPRSIYECAARDIARIDAYVTSRREREKIEMLFAHLKRRRFRPPATLTTKQFDGKIARVP
ncbi:hypothetical protein JQ567_14955 [Bradyrhizobium sp. AUGA SZCCT0431]|nr:hypothetical protein [Bradyrhizobium sp. AUGA SZCCT0431]